MKKLLSIDGGGMKGIFAASFLAELERHCKKPICKYFDLVCGTSTGAIIASALAMGIPAKTILNMYMEKGKEIFPPKRRLPLLKAKYRSEPLKKALDEVFQSSCIKDCKTRLLIPAYNLTSRKVRVFKTPHAEDLYFDKNSKIVDCLLATTAAPTYFSPHKMEGGVFIDGGVGANNPSLIALVEGITRCGWDISDISLLSVGSVNELSPTTGDEKMGLLDAAKILNCFMNAESRYAENICNIMLPKGQYIRVTQQVLRGEASLDQATGKSMEKLKDWGTNAAMNCIADVKNMFFTDEIEDVTFYNLDNS